MTVNKAIMRIVITMRKYSNVVIKLRPSVGTSLSPIIFRKQAAKAMVNINTSRIGDPIFSDTTGETKYTKLTRH